MLFKVDSHFGHVVEETDCGLIYQADGAIVDKQNPRPCAGCQVKCSEGMHDPCITNLPGTRNACCGHGLDLAPNSQKPNGYVSLEDGRTFRFSGLVGGTAIRQALDAALSGEELPAGFVYDEQKAWWSGLSDAQRQYVQANMTTGLARLVSEATDGAPLSQAIILGQTMWYEGLDEGQKAFVHSRINTVLNGLVLEALAQTN